MQESSRCHISKIKQTSTTVPMPNFGVGRSDQVQLYSMCLCLALMYEKSAMSTSPSNFSLSEISKLFASEMVLSNHNLANQLIDTMHTQMADKDVASKQDLEAQITISSAQPTLTPQQRCLYSATCCITSSTVEAVSKIKPDTEHPDNFAFSCHCHCHCQRSSSSR